MVWPVVIIEIIANDVTCVVNCTHGSVSCSGMIDCCEYPVLLTKSLQVTYSVIRSHNFRAIVDARSGSLRVTGIGYKCEHTICIQKRTFVGTAHNLPDIVDPSCSCECTVLWPREPGKSGIGDVFECVHVASASDHRGSSTNGHR